MIDISHWGAEEVERRFAGMVARTRQIGRDLAREPVEISPTSHFAMGGVIIDHDCQTSVPGLLVAGEDAGGVHGANRLGGNGVAESTVFGARAGDRAAVVARERNLRDPDPAQVAVSLGRALAPLQREKGPSPFHVTRDLKETMWEGCGVVRAEEGLREALGKLEEIRKAAEDVDVRPDSEGYGDLAHALDLRASLVAAEASLLGAAERRESRGAHQRSDHPHLDPSLTVNFVISNDDNCQLTVSREPVPPVPDHLRGWAEGDNEVEVAGRLLE